MALGNDDGKPGAKGGAKGAGKAGAGRAGGMGKPGAGAKPGGMGAKKPGMGGAKPGSASKPGGFGAKGASSSSSRPGGMMGSKPGGSGGMMGKSSGMGAGKPPMGKPGAMGAKPGAMGAKPGGMGAKPGAMGAKPGAPGAKPGAPGAKPGAMGAKPGAMGAKPGAPGAKPGAPAAKPGAPAAKPGAMGAKPGAPGAKPGVVGAKPGAVGAKPGAAGARSGALGGAKAGVAAPGAGKAGTAITAQNAARTAASLKTSHDVAKGMAPQKSTGSSGGTGDRDDRVLRNASANGGAGAVADSGGTSRNIPLSQMDKIDLTKLSPRELMQLERQYGSGWLKTIAPTQFNRLQSVVGGAALTSATPTALSSHIDPSQLQIASGITGTGVTGGQISCPSNSESMGEIDPEQFRPLDAACLAEHPEQIGEVSEEMEEYDEEYEEDIKIPSDLMRAKLIDGSLAGEEEYDGGFHVAPPVTTLDTSPMTTHAAPHHMTPPSHATSHLTATQQTPLPPPQLPHSQVSSCSAPPAEEEEEEEEEEEMHLTITTQMGATSPSFYCANNPYGENLYSQQQGYEQVEEQYRMSAPLLDRPDSAFPQAKEIHKSYYHFSQNTDPNKYNFTRACDNYDGSSRTDGTYCYSCVMFFGVLMIGAGIIMVIVELFGLFGKNKHMPMAIAGAGVLVLGILVLATAMLTWRRKRSSLKKKAVLV